MPSSLKVLINDSILASSTVGFINVSVILFLIISISESAPFAEKRDKIKKMRITGCISFFTLVGLKLLFKNSQILFRSFVFPEFKIVPVNLQRFSLASHVINQSF
jgi:hypothetical protein